MKPYCLGMVLVVEGVFNWSQADVYPDGERQLGGLVGMGHAEAPKQSPTLSSIRVALIGSWHLSFDPETFLKREKCVHLGKLVSSEVLPPSYVFTLWNPTRLVRFAVKSPPGYQSWPDHPPYSYSTGFYLVTGFTPSCFVWEGWKRKTPFSPVCELLERKAMLFISALP